MRKFIAIVLILLSAPALAAKNANSVYRMPNSGNIPSWGQLNLSSSNAVTGTRPITNGGAGLTSTAQEYVFAGTTGGSGAPTWRLLTANDIPSLSSLYCSLGGCTMGGAVAMAGYSVT